MKESQKASFFRKTLAKLRSEESIKQQELEKKRKQEQAEIKRIKKDFKNKIVPLEQKFLEKCVPPVLQDILNAFLDEVIKYHFGRRIPPPFPWPKSFFYGGRDLLLNPYEGFEREEFEKKKQILEMYEDGSLSDSFIKVNFEFELRRRRGPTKHFSFTVYNSGEITCEMGVGHSTFDITSQSGLEDLSLFLAKKVARGDWFYRPPYTPSDDRDIRYN